MLQCYGIIKKEYTLMKILEIKKSVFADNDAEADKLRAELAAKGTLLINLMSSPGSGKTSTILAVADRLGEGIRLGVMEADIDSDVDALAMSEAGIPAIQIHTDGMCHLDAGMTRTGLEAPEMHDQDIIILENVGNLVCPAEFDTGANLNVMILSVPEGDDKPLKYPLMFSVCDLLIINKIDTVSLFDFDFEAAEARARAINPAIEIIKISAKTGEGIDKIVNWIAARRPQ
jgi:hydrogenase nickel incorporation protein HypB